MNRETRRKLISLGCEIGEEGDDTVVLYPAGTKAKVEKVLADAKVQGTVLRLKVYTGFGYPAGGGGATGAGSAATNRPDLPAIPSPMATPAPVEADMLRPLRPEGNRAAAQGDLGGGVDDG